MSGTLRHEFAERMTMNVGRSLILIEGRPINLGTKRNGDIVTRPTTIDEADC